MTDQINLAARRVRSARPGRAHARPSEPALQGSLHDAVRPCLTGVTYLVRRDPLPPLDVVYEHAHLLLARAKLRLDGLALDPLDAQDAYYALIAYIDEVLQSKPGPLEEFWQAHLLQLEHFGETRAGEGFFTRLERACSDGRLAAVRVYYVCLLLGFRGIYDAHGELERQNLIARVRELLGASSSAAGEPLLAPYGARPHEPGVDRTRNWLVQSVAMTAMALAALWYLSLVYVVAARADGLRSALESAHQALVLGRDAPPWEAP
jgi:type VI secretion system protein ImpK